MSWDAIGAIFGVAAFLFTLFLTWPQFKKRLDEQGSDIVAVAVLLLFYAPMIIATFFFINGNAVLGGVAMLLIPFVIWLISKLEES